ncbi:D-isomer specific 2-hydroxyacid dehydrogenase [Nemania sp. FL0031]|nr:D-isomer specific 2-hydroxyacid dehydrogenase [Nemania sp. FL0031]
MDMPKEPKQPPSSTHEVIVVIDDCHLVVDHVDTSPRSHEIISYRRITQPEEVCRRIQCASIVIATQTFITAESLGEAPHLKCVITPTSGTNHIDLEECKRRGIKVAKCPGSISPAVADHALSLYFAARRKTVLLHNDIRTVDEHGKNSWKRERSVASKTDTANKHPPCSIEDETVGIIGHGFIGKRLATFCEALGMKVLIAERKSGTSTRNNTVGETTERTPFDEVIRTATVLFICCLSDEHTINMIDAAEIGTMKPEMIIVIVSRGNVVNTAEVIKALREQRISGAAADVFDQEPASTEEDSAFLAEDTKDLNLTFSPHVGYYSTKTDVVMKKMVREQIKNFVNEDFSKFEVL